MWAKQGPWDPRVLRAPSVTSARIQRPLPALTFKFQEKPQTTDSAAAAFAQTLSGFKVDLSWDEILIKVSSVPGRNGVWMDNYKYLRTNRLVGSVSDGFLLDSFFKVYFLNRFVWFKIQEVQKSMHQKVILPPVTRSHPGPREPGSGSLRRLPEIQVHVLMYFPPFPTHARIYTFCFLLLSINHMSWRTFLISVYKAASFF